MHLLSRLSQLAVLAPLALVSALSPCSQVSGTPCSCPNGTQYQESVTFIVIGAAATDVRDLLAPCRRRSSPLHSRPRFSFSWQAEVSSTDRSIQSSIRRGLVCFPITPPEQIFSPARRAPTCSPPAWASTISRSSSRPSPPTRPVPSSGNLNRRLSIRRPNTTPRTVASAGTGQLSNRNQYFRTRQW